MIHQRWSALSAHHYSHPTVHAQLDLRLITSIACVTTRQRPTDIRGSVCPSSRVTIINAFKRTANLRVITPCRVHIKFNCCSLGQELPCPAIRTYPQPVQPKPRFSNVVAITKSPKRSFVCRPNSAINLELLPSMLHVLPI